MCICDTMRPIGKVSVARFQSMEVEMFRKTVATFLILFAILSGPILAFAQETVPNAPPQRYVVFVPDGERGAIPAGLIPIQSLPTSKRDVPLVLRGYFIWDVKDSGPLPDSLKSMATLVSPWDQPQLVTYSATGEILPVQIVEFEQDHCIFPQENWGTKKMGVEGAINNLNPTTHVTVTVAIVDSGAELEHVCFKGRVSAGWNFADSTSIVPDDNGHGTHVSGLVLQACPGCTVVMYKAFSKRNGGGPITISQSIIQAVADGADAISISLNGQDASGVVCSAVSLAARAGIPVFVAAGNYGKEIEGVPASCPGVIAVSATEQFDGYTDWSSYPGTDLDSGIRTVAAPGNLIISTFPCGSPFGCYAFGSGTSMSAPLAAGGAALMMERGYTTQIDIAKLLSLAVEGYHPTMKFKRVELGGTYGSGDSILPQILNPTTYPPVISKDGGVMELCFNTGYTPANKAGAVLGMWSNRPGDVSINITVPFTLTTHQRVGIPLWCGNFTLEENKEYDRTGIVLFWVESFSGGSWNAHAPWRIGQVGEHGVYVPGALECWRSDRFCTFVPLVKRK